MFVPVTHRISDCPICHSFPGGEAQQNSGIVLLVPPLFPPPTLPHLITHIPTYYTLGEINNTHLHMGRGEGDQQSHKSVTADQACPKMWSHSGLVSGQSEH